MEIEITKAIKFLKIICYWALLWFHFLVSERSQSGVKPEPNQTSKMEIFAKIINCCHFHCSCLTRFWIHLCVMHLIRSSHPEVFLGKSVLEICSRSTGEHTCPSAKLLCNFIEITLRHGCSSVNLLHIFRTPFLKNTSGWLLLLNVNSLTTK